MTVKKIDIIKNISHDLEISTVRSKNFFETFIELVKTVSSNKDIKLSGFGTFSYVQTLKRIGRNPKTKKTYIITPRKKLSLRVSNHVRRGLN